MAFVDALEDKYVDCVSNFCRIGRYIKTKFHKVKFARCYVGDNKYNISKVRSKYILLKFSKCLTKSAIKSLDTKLDMLTVHIRDYSFKKNIIFENINISNISTLTDNITNEPNDIMVNLENIIVISINLIKSDGKKLDLSKLFINYADPTQQYAHTIKNIFKVTKTQLNNNETIEVNYYEGCDSKKYIYTVGDIADKHYTFIYNNLLNIGKSKNDIEEKLDIENDNSELVIFPNFHEEEPSQNNNVKLENEIIKDAEDNTSKDPNDVSRVDFANFVSQLLDSRKNQNTGN
jgi:hypothetical protein